MKELLMEIGFFIADSPSTKDFLFLLINYCVVFFYHHFAFKTINSLPSTEHLFNTSKEKSSRHSLDGCNRDRKFNPSLLL